MHTEMDILVMENFLIYKDDKALPEGGFV